MPEQFFFPRVDPGYVKPSGVRRSPRTLPTPTEPEPFNPVNDDPLFSPPKVDEVSAEWKLRKCVVGPDEATSKWGRRATLELTAGGYYQRLNIEDRTNELFRDPIRQATFDALDNLATVRHLRALQQQFTDAERGKRIATAQLARLRGEREVAVAEAAPGLAKKLQRLDREIAEQSEKLQECEADLTSLEPEIERELAVARQLFGDAFAPAYRQQEDEYRRLLAENDKALAAAINDVLTRRLELETARHAATGLRQELEREWFQRLRTLPQNTAETCEAAPA